jgi:hypothetical protein
MRGYGLPIDYNFLLSRANMKDPVVRKKVGEAAQDTLKYLGDHVAAGAVFHDLFKQNWGVHRTGMLAYRSKGDWFLAPNGITIEDHIANNPDTVFQRDKKFIDEKVQSFYAAVEKIR